MIQLDLNTEIGMMTQKWVSNQELWSFRHLIPSVSEEKEKALNTPQIPNVPLEIWLLPSPPKLCQTRLAPSAHAHTIMPQGAQTHPCPGLPPSPAHPTPHVHMEWLNGLSTRERKTQGHQGKDLYGTNRSTLLGSSLSNYYLWKLHWENTFTLRPLSCSHASHAGWLMGDRTEMGLGMHKRFGLCSEALWHTPGDVWPMYLDGRWAEGWKWCRNA